MKYLLMTPTIIAVQGPHCRSGALDKNTEKAYKLTEVEIVNILVILMFKPKLELHEHINCVIH